MFAFITEKIKPYNHGSQLTTYLQTLVFDSVLQRPFAVQAAFTVHYALKFYTFPCICTNVFLNYQMTVLLQEKELRRLVETVRDLIIKNDAVI